MIDTNLLDFSKVRLLVVGDVMLDSYWHGNTSRISPEAPVPVVKISNNQNRLGGAANVACNIRQLKATVYLLGVTGNDEVASQLKGILDKQDIDHQLITINGMKTIRKIRILSHQQQLLRLDFEQSIANYDFDLLPPFRQLLEKVDAVVFSDYNKGTLKQIQLLIDTARSAKKLVLVDPKRDFKYYKGAHIIKPNLLEFQTMVGNATNDQDISDKGQPLLEKYHLDALLITRGTKGMTLLQTKEQATHIPATETKEVFDITGAGDTSIATLSCALALGHDLISATRLANIAASIAVSKLGTSYVTQQELKQALNLQIKRQSGHIMTEDELILAIKQAKAKKETIVMTNGCFDILHPGHTHYLEQAKKLGDRLIVAVNDDDSVTKLKGENRPINSLSSRLAVLQALASVDWVIPFSETTPEALIKRLAPDILVKGGDYKVEQIAGSDFVIQSGGEVKIVDFVESYSTTKLLERIQFKSNSEVTNT